MRPPPHSAGSHHPPRTRAPTFASAQAQNGRHLLPALPARREGGGHPGREGAEPGRPSPRPPPELPHGPFAPRSCPAAAGGPSAGPRKAQRGSRDTAGRPPFCVSVLGPGLVRQPPGAAGARRRRRALAPPPGGAAEPDGAAGGARWRERARAGPPSAERSRAGPAGASLCLFLVPCQTEGVEGCVFGFV